MNVKKFVHILLLYVCQWQQNVKIHTSTFYKTPMEATQKLQRSKFLQTEHNARCLSRLSTVDDRPWNKSKKNCSKLVVQTSWDYGVLLLLMPQYMNNEWQIVAAETRESRVCGGETANKKGVFTFLPH